MRAGGHEQEDEVNQHERFTESCICWFSEKIFSDNLHIESIDTYLELSSYLNKIIAFLILGKELQLLRINSTSSFLANHLDCVLEYENMSSCQNS